MLAYHDEEWGIPSHDHRYLYEMLTLEGAQAGLSWSTILRKREGYRQAFAGFEPQVVARFTAKDVERLLADPGIVRNRLKVETTVSNASRVLEVQARTRKPRFAPLVIRRRRADRHPLALARRASGRDRASAEFPVTHTPEGRFAAARGLERLRYARVVSETMSARFTSWIAARKVAMRSSPSSSSVPPRHRS